MPLPHPISIPITSNATSLLNMINLLPLTRPLDHPREIHNRQAEREIHARQHDSQEDIPTQQARDERERPRRLLALGRDGRVALRRVDEGAREQPERRDQREEDEEEDEVGAHCADEVDQAQHAHADHEVG